MQRFLIILMLFAITKVSGQTTGYLRFDTVKIMKQNGACELYIINSTKDSLGVLTNIGGGRTTFLKSRLLNDSVLIVGRDTITVRGVPVSLSRNIYDYPLVVEGNTGRFKFRKQLVDTFVSKKYTQTWQRQLTPDSLIWTNLTWSPELRLLVVTSHSSSTQNIMTSPDGIVWTQRTVPNTNNLRSVAWSPKLQLFATVASTGSGNRVNTSPDGITWTARTTPANYIWRDMIWVEELGLFIAVANDSGQIDKVMTSPDGINWTLRTTPDRAWNVIRWSPELQLIVVVASGDVSGNKVMTSPDGINWTLRTTPFAGGPGNTASWEGLCWSGDLRLFVATAYSGDSVNGRRVMTSPDGIEWTSRATPAAANQQWLGVDWSPQYGIFAAVADGGTGQQIMASPDGVTWTVQNSDTRDWRRIKWVRELGSFVSVAFYDGTARGDSLIMLSLTLDDRQQYLLTYGRNTRQTIRGQLNFKNQLEVNGGIVSTDSIVQTGTSVINKLQGSSYFGNRTVEGTNDNFFATSVGRFYDEQTISSNPTKTASLSTFRYLFLNDGAVLSGAMTAYSSSVPRLKGAVNMNNGVNQFSFNQFDLLFTRASDFTASPVVTGPPTPDLTICDLQARIGATNAGSITMNGWYAAFTTRLQLNGSAHSMENAADWIAGSSLQANSSTVTNRYGAYILPIKQSWVTNAYAIKQIGTQDTVEFNGFLKASKIYLDRTITAGGTTGDQTINKIAGTVNFAAGATSLTVTNSFVTANSLVIPFIRTVDATAKNAVIVCSAGSFVITLNAAATAETSVGFLVTN